QPGHPGRRCARAARARTPLVPSMTPTRPRPGTPGRAGRHAPRNQAPGVASAPQRPGEEPMATTEARAGGAPAALSAATMRGALMTTLAERPDAVALRTPDDCTRMTYAELGARIRDGAAGLAALGVRPRDAVGLMPANR